MTFSDEFEKFFETYIIGKHRERIQQEEKNFEEMCRHFEGMKKYEKAVQSLDKLDLKDPFHSS